MSAPARRIPFFIVALALLMALAPAASAQQRSFAAQRVSGTSADFRVTGIAAGDVDRARLTAGTYRTSVSASRITRGARRGTLRLALPRRVARGLASARRGRSGRKPGWPTLTIQTPGTTPRPPDTAAASSPAASPAPGPAVQAPSPSATGQAPAPPADSGTSGAPGTPVAQSTSSFETGNFSEFTSLQNKFGSLSVTSNRSYDGTRSARATWAGGPQGAQRVWQDTNWHNGSEVWYGMAVYVPTDTNYCYWNPIRWDNYDLYGGVDDDTPGEGDVGGLSVEQNRIYIMKSYYGGIEHKLVDGGVLAKGRWTWLELHQKFSDRDGDALSELYVDGQKRGFSTKANSAGRRITDLRAGVVNVASDCSTPNSIDFDRVTISNTQRGPLS